MSVACVVIAGGKRTALLDEKVIPSVLAQEFDEVVVVGDHHEGEGYRYLHVPALTSTTNDALVKRDCGTVATDSEILVYLSDDHALLDGFHETVKQLAWQEWDVFVPARFADHPTEGRIRIPNGEGSYCGGHSGVFRRRVIQHRPWSAQPHHRLWDLLASEIQLRDGFRFCCVGDMPLAVIDLEPEHTPWL